MFTSSEHSPWMQVAIENSFSKKCHCCFKILPLGYLLSFKLVQWSIVATDAPLHCWACLLNACMIYWHRAWKWNIVQTGVLFQGLTWNSIKKHIWPIKKYQVRCNGCRLEGKSKGSKSTVCCTDIENRWIPPIRMTCMLYTFFQRSVNW